MKGRSHRLPPSEPPDDWINGSWTVDCSCGVTFDDGEEMVSCDECGVWVHTRCSRFSKGDSSFACHKCTAPSSSAGDLEETEVARLLAELPTKAADICFPPPPPPPPRRPFRLWAEVPIQERVHVHGVPGGDPSLFRGLSSVFTSDLWKCTGYVPKKFDFQYRDFPCWDADEEKEDGGENQASQGADVLFSLSKEIAPRSPTFTNIEWRPSVEGIRKRDGSKTPQGRRSQSSGKEGNNRIRVLGVHSGKRKEWSDSKVRSTKKKARSGRHRAMSNDEKRGSIHLVDMNKSDLFEDGSLQVEESKFQDGKTGDRKESLASEPSSSVHMEGKDGNNKRPRNILVVKAPKGGSENDGLKQKDSLEALVKVEKVEQLEFARPGNTTDDYVPSIEANVEESGPERLLVKVEDASNVVHLLKQSKEEEHYEDVNGSSYSAMMNFKSTKHAVDLGKNGYSGMLDSPKLPYADVASLPSSTLDQMKVKNGVIHKQAAGEADMPSCPADDRKLHDVHQLPQNLQTSLNHTFEIPPQHETSRSLETYTQKSHGEDVASEGCHKNTVAMISKLSESKQHEEATIEEHKNFEGKYNIKFADESTKSEGSHIRDLESNDGKLVVGSGKVSSTLSSQAMSKSVSGSQKPPVTTVSSTLVKSGNFSRQQQGNVSVCTIGKKDDVSSEATSTENMREVLKEPVKDNPKASICYESKSSLTTRVPRGSTLKHGLLDSKEKLLDSSSKTLDGENLANEVAGSSQTQCAASVQVRVKSSGSCQKNDKYSQPNSQLPSKVVNNSVGMHRPASVSAVTNLSDEELALLLHQELNSSPRVPRVPRVRQAANMQLASPTGTSVLPKRYSFFGGKDQIPVPKRRNKEDSLRDSARNRRELSGEAKRISKHPTSPDKKHQVSALITDGSLRKDACSRSPDSGMSGRKIAPFSSDAAPNNCNPHSSEANEQNILSVANSTRDVFDDDSGFNSRTLPSLIAEIMKEGRRMSIEELCEAVHPHWDSLRKPNGERYAYSNHSQAVMDCLRNRSEWSRLIDRGPKINSSRKRRKCDPDTSAEQENEEAKCMDAKEDNDKTGESHPEEFPKGKRKARKRRRLEILERNLKDCKVQKQDFLDNDPTSLSHSSNEEADGPLSDDESQEAGPHSVRADASASSDDDS